MADKPLARLSSWPICGSLYRNMSLNEPSPMNDKNFQRRIITEINRIVLGKQQQVELALICLISQGHLLIEDIPGMGKTTLAKAMARVFGLEFKRVQFTNDLLPADITGMNIFDSQSRRFRFHPGPVFSQLLLADEINRAHPKTQSALLEAMEERQVTVDGESHPLNRPFSVIATQNPLEMAGTYPLPESQLDRFMMRISLGYPDPEAERRLLERGPRDEQAQTICTPEDLLRFQQEATTIHTGDRVLDVIQQLLNATREPGRFVHGLSPRAGRQLVRAAQARAWWQGRDFVIPEDVQHVFPALAAHRLIPAGTEQDVQALVAELTREIPLTA